MARHRSVSAVLGKRVNRPANLLEDAARHEIWAAAMGELGQSVR
jgi:hypothetical protein